MRLTTSILINLFAFIALLSSCNLSNKLASSFEKRKYTKGYYVDNVEPQNPVLSANTKIQGIKYKPVIQAEENSTNNKTKSCIALAGPNLVLSYYKTQSHVKTYQITSAKKQQVFFKKTIENTFLRFPNGLSSLALADADKDADTKTKDTAAILGLVFGALSVLIILISLALTAGSGIYLGALLLSMCLGIAGLSKGIEGIKSEKYKNYAIAGIVLGSATLIFAIILFALALKNNML